MSIGPDLIDQIRDEMHEDYRRDQEREEALLLEDQERLERRPQTTRKCRICRTPFQADFYDPELQCCSDACYAESYAEERHWTRQMLRDSFRNTDR